MDLLSYIPETTGQQDFHLRVNVLHVILEHEAAIFYVLCDSAQTLVEEGEFFRGEQSYAFQHPDVGL